MFGAGSQERWTTEERAEFETYTATRLRGLIRRALFVSVFFIGSLCAIVPFSKGYFLYKHAEPTGRFIVYLAEAALVWSVIRWGYVYTEWQTAREIRREVADPK